MQTFSQYAATRPLRSSSSGTAFGTDTVVAGSIQTFAGVDVVTGMPVIIYTMQGQAPSIPEVYSESIPALLETGLQNETGFVVVSSAPGYLPLRLGLSQVRLEWLTRVSAKALSDAHTAGLVHGDLNPGHFFVQGDHLLLEGWGLDWQNTQADFTPPEGQGASAADVFAWARSMQAFGKGDPRKLLDGEMGRLIGHCLNPKPQERPTALELVIALEQVIVKKVVKPEVRPVQLNEVKAVQLPEVTTIPLEQVQPVPLPEAVPVPLEPAVSAEVIPTLTPESSVRVIAQSILEKPLHLEPFHESPQPLKLESIEILGALTPIDEGIKIVAKTKAPELTPTTEIAIEPAIDNLAKPIVEVLPETVPEQIQTALPKPAHPPEKPFKKGKTKNSSKPKIPVLGVTESELREPENLAADEPDIVPSIRPEYEPTPPVHDGSIEPGVVIYKDMPSPIRVGFDEDDTSWRSVKTYQAPKRSPFLIPIMLGIAVLFGILGIILLKSQPKARSGATINTPTIGAQAQNSIVNFVMNTSSNQTARLTVISAPKEAKLAFGTLLATIPSPVLFTYPGEYRLKVKMVNPNFSGEVTVNVPQDKEIVVTLPK